MAEKVQVNPQITASTRDLLKLACQQHGKAQGDIIEEALLAYLAPAAGDSTLTRLAAEQAQLGVLVREVHAIVGELLSALGGPAPLTQPSPPSNGAAPIATYAQMYGAIPATDPPQEIADLAARARQYHAQKPELSSGLLRRWFRKEENA